MTPVVWLATVATTLALVALAMLLLGVSLVLRGRPLRGSCGGECEACACGTRRTSCDVSAGRP